MATNRLKQCLTEGRPALGPFCKFTDPAACEIAGLAGFDFAIVDMEHGPISIERAQDLLRACEVAGLSPVIRVPANEEHEVLRALDIGAHGVQVPEINTRGQAEKLAASARYHPRGRRGVCRFVRASRYTAVPREQVFERANDAVTVIAHIEGLEGFRNLDDILAVDGLDVIFIGPYDLSQSLGVPGRTDDPKVVATMEDIARRAAARGRAVGTFVETPEQARRWIAAGVRYVSYSVDVGILMSAYQAIVKAVHGEK
jgi:4-hydroxy-2-oxoheptanedioate aldolase